MSAIIHTAAVFLSIEPIARRFYSFADMEFLSVTTQRTHMGLSQGELFNMVNKHPAPHSRHAQREFPEHRPLAVMRELRGFTTVELVTVMVIAGVLAAMVAPRFFDHNVFESRGFYDQVISTLRYAQKTAIAQHRFVCVAFTTGSIKLTYGADATCGNDLSSPTGQTPYTVDAPSGVSLNGYSNFNFNALGVPSVPQNNISVSGFAAASITVEAETGYVH